MKPDEWLVLGLWLTGLATGLWILHSDYTERRQIRADFEESVKRFEEREKKRQQSSDQQL